MPRAKLFAISGPRHSRRSELYSYAERRIQSDFPNHQVVCIGSPFPNLVCPLLWNEAQWALAPSTRLLGLWPGLNEHCLKRIRPLQETNTLILSLGLGLDAVLNAAVGPNFEMNDEGIKEAFDVQEGLVDNRIRKQGISPPDPYIIVDADPRRVSERMEGVTALAAVPPELRLKFNTYERQLVDRYFDDLPGQRGVKIPGEKTVEEMYRDMLDIIHDSITLRAVA